MSHNSLPIYFKFKVIDGTKLGKAVVATEKIREGEIICKMSGPIITLREISLKYGLGGVNPLQIGEDIYLDLIEPYVCFNHSCEPNAGIRNKGILFALKDIKPNEEIFYDYSTTSDDTLWSMECYCASKNCRKIICDFQSIPHERKEFYLSKSAITSHVQSIYYN